MRDSQREDCAEGRKFSILGFESTDGAITADFDPNSSAAEFTLAPKVDVEKLKPGSSGVIEIRLSHPQHRSVSIPYTVLAEFAARPAMIAIMGCKPGQAVTRDVTIASN